MVNAVSYGSQPQIQEKKKPSVILPAVVGGAAGAGVGYFTDFAKKAKYENVDTFVKTGSKDDLKDIKDENKTDKEALESAFDAEAKAKTATDEKIKALFPDEKTTSAKLSDVLGKMDDAPKAEDLRAIVSADNAEEAIKTEETKLAEIKKATVEKGKTAEVTVGDKVYQVSKGEDDAISFVEGKMEGEEGKKTFKAAEGATPKALKGEEEAVAIKRSKFDLATTLGIKKDTNLAEHTVNKESTAKAYGEVKTTASEAAKTAFENIKKALPKEIHGLKMAGLIGGGLALGAGLAYLIGGGSKE